MFAGDGTGFPVFDFTIEIAKRDLLAIIFDDVFLANNAAIKIARQVLDSR